MISSRTPEGEAQRCPVCGAGVVIEPSRPPGDAPCPNCGHLLWFHPCLRSLRDCRRVGVEEAAETAFEAEGWRGGSLRTRGAMARDLVRRGGLDGLDARRVMEILGEPDASTEGRWSYVVYRGVRITWRGSAHRLRVDFDGEGWVCGVAVEEIGR